MTTFTNNKMRGVAILTGGVLMSTTLLHPAPAQAAEKKDKLYKGGAAVLGVLGALFILKGKTVPGAIAGAGAYYAYKKGKEAKNDDRYNDGRYSENRSNNRSNRDRYSDNSYPANDTDYSNNDDSNNDYSDNVYSGTDYSNDDYTDGVYAGTDYSDTDYSDDYSSDDVYDGRWKTPSSNSNRNRNDRSDDDYRGAAPSADDGSTIVLE